ncbi:flagellar basal body rod protein FlgB [Evansella sp. AB-P1]|uniref:flagellar basal body rod protein FlgB n=1 Tax=Evansella sp. AB-P1 TaxID=3037653 RepID=UPI00241DF2A4|nr:flagellar basal body rod protein FlgB [Evansella sp. AB-P1]MDG5788196.1 flagellar basal body rod protein FlgB [Evansella sp. AB-P1]
MNLINNSTHLLLQSAINSSMVRQNTIAQNIANVDTPNFKAKKTVFTHELNNAMENQRLAAYRTNEQHLEFGGRRGLDDFHRVVDRKNTQYNHNGNNVDIDLEMAELAQNQIYYNTLIERLNGRYNSVRTVLGQGR